MANPVRLDGVKELNHALAKLAQSLPPEKVEPVLERAGEYVCSRGRWATPYDPNRTRGIHLRDAWVAKLMPRRRSDRAAPAIAAMDYKKAPHAGLVEFGTVRASPHPYFRPTWDSLHAEVREQVMGELEQLIEEAAKE